MDEGKKKDDGKNERENENKNKNVTIPKLNNK